MAVAREDRLQVVTIATKIPGGKDHITDALLALPDRRNYQTTAHINLSRSYHTISGMMTPDQISCSDPSRV